MTGLFDREGHLAELAAHRRLADELDVDQRREVDEHLSGCADCRARVDGLAAIVAAPLPPLRLPGRAPVGSPPVRPHVVERPRDIGVASLMPVPPPARPPARRMLPMLVGGLALAAGLVLALRLASTGLRPEDAPETFTTRGGAFRLEVFRDAGTVSERLADGSSVAAGDRLAFRVADPTGGNLVVVGVDGAGVVYPVWPADASGTRPWAGRAEAAQLDVAIAVDAAPGGERLVAVRCPAPLAWADVAARLGAVVGAHPLPTLWPACVQDEVRLEKAPPKGP